MKFLAQIKKNIYTQSYEQSTIQGVYIHQFQHIPSDEGDFSEVLRLSPKGHLLIFPSFKLRQLNRTEMFPGCIKAWHLHKKQNEIWYVPPIYHLVAGLWDFRDKSITKNKTMKIILGSGNSKLLFIPKGVAHGSVNLSNKSVQLFTFVDMLFDKKKADEYRLPWDSLSADFWKPERD